MERRAAIGALLAPGIIGAGYVRAERIARVGLVFNSLPQVEVDRDLMQFYGPRVMVEALRRKGWVRGRNLEILALSAEERYERFAAFVDQLVALAADVIVVFGSDSAETARSRARGIPIVDVVAFNQAPGRGSTGMVVMNPMGKRLDLLKQLVPKARRVALFGHAPKGHGGPEVSAEDRAQITRVGMTAIVLHFTTMEDLDRAFDEARRWGADAVYMSGFPKLYWDREVQDHVLGLPAANRWPAVYENPELAERGALIAFGPDVRTTHERAAYFIDRILKGAKPSDLPAEQPTGFVLTLNRRTARDLGLAIPASLALQAQEIFD